MRCVIECGCFLARLLPARTQRLETRANADASADDLSGDGRTFVVQRVQAAEFELIHADFVGERIIELFLRDGPLRNAKAAERAGGKQIRMNRARDCAEVRDFVRT